MHCKPSFPKKKLKCDFQLCHEKCEGEARQREHEKSQKHGKVGLE